MNYRRTNSNATFESGGAVERTESSSDARPFVLERISDRARVVRIEVRSGSEVHLIIPRTTSREAAREFLASRTGWVRLRLAEMRERQAVLPPPRPVRWDGKDRLPVFGKELALRWVPASVRGCVVRIGDGEVNVLCRSYISQQARREALVNALRELARTEFSRCLESEAGGLGVDYKRLRIGDPSSRWGSCSPAGVISLSWRLIMAPNPVQRYVALHELCHRRHFNHSDRFWHLLSTRMPGYAIQRAWLRDHGACLNAVLPRSPSGMAASKIPMCPRKTLPLHRRNGS